MDTALVPSYIGPEFSKILEKPNVEYKQANLTVECVFQTRNLRISVWFILEHSPHSGRLILI
jgi:hypothetical protein